MGASRGEGASAPSSNDDPASGGMEVARVLDFGRGLVCLVIIVVEVRTEDDVSMVSLTVLAFTAESGSTRTRLSGKGKDSWMLFSTAGATQTWSSC